MKNQMMDKKVIKAISLGLAAVMMTTPMTFLSSAGSRVMVRQNDGSFGSPAKDEKEMPYEHIELR